MYMAYLLIKSADLLPTDLYILLKKWMFYLMGDVLTKTVDLLMTNMSGWSANWSLNLVDLLIVW